jgi:hypothetical protein
MLLRPARQVLPRRRRPSDRGDKCLSQPRSAAATRAIRANKKVPIHPFAAFFFFSCRKLKRTGAAKPEDKKAKPKRQHSAAMQGLEAKPSKKVGCKAKIVVRVLRDKPDQAEIELKGVHNHDMDLTQRRLLPEMREYVVRTCAAQSTDLLCTDGSCRCWNLA